MNRRELGELAAEELRHKETELRDEIFRLKMKRAASALDNKMLIRNHRKDLARVITLLRQKTQTVEGKAK
ncbi:MAG: 50S ribosomal protein L29 [Deltaproteobacteria bacterium RBG_19FT_COMBO_60_16]|nr:MAG: 50S ribosomal protein L29 [Deltaproteobacteria bacterium RBG_16_64_85]OGP99825.1 MAG: 50S ribosomal protein L29 [Deltaproteobacteria bacterium RBG_19FT_COMBO_60_16]